MTGQFWNSTLLFWSACLYSTAGVPIVSCFVLHKEGEKVSPVWLPGISQWRMEVSDQGVEETSLAGCLLWQDHLCLSEMESGPQNAVFLWCDLPIGAPTLSPGVPRSHRQVSGPGPAKRESAYYQWNCKSISLAGSVRLNLIF